MEPSRPIKYHSNPVSPTVAVAIRQMVAAICTILATEGFINHDTEQALLPAGVALVTLGWGLISSHIKNQKIATFGRLLPDSVAKEK